MLLVPELRAERLLLEHVHVIEPFGGMIARVFDQRVIRALDVPEPALPGWLDTGRLRLRDLRFRAPEHASGARPRVAADEHGPAAVTRVER